MRFFCKVATTDAGAADQKNWLLGLSVPPGAAVLRTSYHRLDSSSTISKRDARQFSLGAQYNLSRRTAVYANYADIDNNAASGFTVATGSALSAGRDSKGCEPGLRHSF